MQKSRFTILSLLRIILIVVVAIGVTAQQFSSFFSDYGGYVALFYFTTQSNIFLLVINVFLLTYELRGKEKTKLLLVLEHLSVSAIALTFFVFALLLSPFIEQHSYFYSVTNITLHNVAPILGIGTYLMTNIKYKVSPFIAVASGLYYLVFAYAVHFIRGNFGPTEFPYFFLDYKTYGWFTFSPPDFGVFFYFIFILFLLIGISYLLLQLKENKRKQKVVKAAFIVLFSVAFIFNLMNVLLKLPK